MGNYISIKETNNGFIIHVNEYSTDSKSKGVYVARTIEELKEILEKEVYPYLCGR